MANTPVVDVEKVLNALEVWIKQRPGLDFANYGELRAWRSEVREIGKQRQRALKALAAIRRSVTQDGALLAESFRSAFSGRLNWTGEKLEYCTGQYWPTEYRLAAAAVLESYGRALARQWDEQHPQTFTYTTIEDVKRANAAVGHCWFDPAAMRFFNTKIESGILGGRYFVTSDRRERDLPKRYSIREAKPNGGIDTVGEFQQYPTFREAFSAAQALAKGSK